MRTLLIFLLVTGSLCGCSGQEYQSGNYEKVYPGDKVINAKKLKDHHVRYERDGSSMTYQLEKVRKNNRNLLQVSISIKAGANTWPDTIYLDAKSLSLAGRALLNKRRGFKADIRIDKTELSAKVEELPGKTLEWKGDYQNSYPHELFEISILNYAIKSLPLSEGYTASVPVFMFNLDFAIGWVDVVVEGRETLKIDGRNYDVWKVNALGGKIGDKTFWISDDLPYALKIHSKGLKPWTFTNEIR